MVQTGEDLLSLQGKLGPLMFSYERKYDDDDLGSRHGAVERQRLYSHCDGCEEACHSLRWSGAP